jgi:hypothetical protein
VNAPTGIIDIRGRQYQTVALRVQMFRERHPDYALVTELVERDAECVVMRATIAAADGRTLATGYAEEYRKASQINRTSALENAETSAIGRALAALGIGGTEYASANEVANAIHQQQEGPGDTASARSAPGPDAAPPARWEEPGSIFSGIAKLKNGLKQLDRDLMGCGDSAEVYALCNTPDWREFCRVAEKHAPWYLRGGEPAPPEFEGLLAKAERMVREFDAAEANHITDVARA